MGVAGNLLKALAVVAVLAFGEGWHAHASGGAVFDPRPGTIVIGDDHGGGLDDHIKFYTRIQQAGIPVRVEGICESGCTIVLMLPPTQVCYTRSASLGFHQASRAGVADPSMTSAIIRRYYPQPVQLWLLAWTMRHGPLQLDFVAYMPAPVIVGLGAGKFCED